ncbi:MAG: DUF86 domain-containing protein [Alphaproteobacteria bacterium]|nr:DUF86 domain-containing protein [Alphaproteobacteria bacterium]
MRAKAFVEGIDFKTFAQEPLYPYAVIRALEIISEASRKLPPEIKDKYPDIPWKQIAGSGNIYRHDYEDVLERLVWETVHSALDPLERVVREELKIFEG